MLFQETINNLNKENNGRVGEEDRIILQSVDIASFHFPTIPVAPYSYNFPLHSILQQIILLMIFENSIKAFKKK